MSKKETINNIVKHKRIIIFSLIAIGMIILIFLVYILTYANNKPKPFKNDTNVKIKNKCDYFDFSVWADEISLKDSPKLKVKGVITNVDKEAKISNVNVYFEVHTNWTNKTDVTDTSSYTFKSGSTLTDSKAEYLTDSYCTLNLKMSYPVKVMPLVRVKKPTVYAKVTYTRSTPVSVVHPDGKTEETVYYKISYSELFHEGKDTKVIS